MHVTVPGWLKALIYIGGVASAIIFPLGLSILFYHYCREIEEGTQIICNGNTKHNFCVYLKSGILLVVGSYL